MQGSTVSGKPRAGTARKRGESQKTSGRANPGCNGCPALCCHDLAVVIEKPRRKCDIEHYKWHLHYDTVSLAIRNKRWYLLVKGRCIYLDDDNLCTIYDRRPRKCRDHNPPECERYGCWYQTRLDTPEELEAYLAREKRKKERRKKRNRAKPRKK